MTDADSFYDKLLASISIPGLPVSTSTENNAPKPPADPVATVSDRHDKGRYSRDRSTSHQGEGEASDARPSKPVAAAVPDSVSDTETRDPPPAPFALAKEVGDGARQPAVPLPAAPAKSDPLISPPAEEPGVPAAESKKPTPATLEAELRRRLMESGLRKRKAALAPEPGGAVTKPSGNSLEKKQKLLVRGFPEDPTSVPEKKPALETQLPGADKAAELRRKLLMERTSLLKHNSSMLRVPGNTPTKALPENDPRSQSPITISSDDADSNISKSPASPPPLNPRSPSGNGLKLRISVPSQSAKNGFHILQTEKLPLDTTLSSIMELFGALNDGDYLFFPGSNARSENSADGVKINIEEGEVKEEGQRFYYEGEAEEEQGQQSYYGNEEIAKPVDTGERGNAIQRTEHVAGATEDASESPAGRLGLNCRQPDPDLHDMVEEPNKPGAGVAGRKTLDDLWADGKELINCVLVRAETRDHGGEEQDEYFPHSGWDNRVSFPGTGKLPTTESGPPQWGFGYGSGLNSDGSMNTPFGYSGPQQSWGGPYLEQAMVSPPTPWFPQQQSFQQPSPAFPQTPQAQTPVHPGFPPENPTSGQNAMHWIPGHTDYATAGWLYGMGGNKTTNPAPIREATITDTVLQPPPPTSDLRSGTAGIPKKRLRGGKRKRERVKLVPNNLGSPGAGKTGGSSRASGSSVR